jgi:phospholipid/cholesterol/gamma-HCH transport system permease protein
LDTAETVRNQGGLGESGFQRPLATASVISFGVIGVARSAGVRLYTAPVSIGAQTLLFGRTVRAAARRGVPLRTVLRQLHVLGTDSLGVVAVGLGFFGATMVAHADREAKPIVQDIVVVGPPFFHLLVREFAPVLTGALCALKGGAMVGAELGTMAQTEQLEALELCAGDVHAELIAPRLIAGLLAVPGLLAVGLLAAVLAAAATAGFYGSDGQAWFDPLLTPPIDVALAFGKAALMGVGIPLAASVRGLRATGGATAVGEATTLAAVDAFLVIVLVDVALSGLAAVAGI